MAATTRQVFFERLSPAIDESLPPAPYRAFHYTKRRSYFLILQSVGRQQHYLGSLYHTRRRAAASGPLHERFTFFITEVYLGGDAHCSLLSIMFWLYREQIQLAINSLNYKSIH